MAATTARAGSAGGRLAKRRSRCRCTAGSVATLCSAESPPWESSLAGLSNVAIWMGDPKADSSHFRWLNRVVGKVLGSWLLVFLRPVVAYRNSLGAVALG